MQTAEQIAAEQLEQVRAVLSGLSAEQLASIGVTIERDDSGLFACPRSNGR